MKEEQGWRLLVGLFLTAIVIVWAWSTAKSGLCELAVQTASHEQKPLPSCFEFWLNRYQSLGAGILALGAAWLATRPVYKQLSEMVRQSAASAIPNFRVLAREIEDEMREMKAIDRRLASLKYILNDYDHEDWHRIYIDWPDKASALSRDIFEAWQFIGNRVDTDTSDPSLHEIRAEGFHVLHGVLDALGDLLDAFRALTTGPDYEMGEDDVSREEEARRRAMIGEQYASWQTWYEGYVPIILEERRAAWRKVREMEHIAAG